MNSPNNNSILSFKRKIYNHLYIGISLIFFGSFSLFGQEIDPNGYNVFHFQNGRISSEGMFKDNLPEGIWKSYYEDGTLKSIGKKIAGKSDSTWLFFDVDGRKARKYEYANDKKNGCAVLFDTLGNVVKEINFINDIAQGEQLEYHADGRLKSKVNLVDGKEEGLFLEFDTTGIVITEGIYEDGELENTTKFNRLDQEGLKTGVWRTYFPNGDIESEVSYEKGEKSGLTKTYDKNGRLIDLKRMKGDTIFNAGDNIVMIKLYKEYYSNGKIKLAGGDNNGKKSGIFREYDQEGNIVNGYIYKDDTLVAEGKILPDGTFEGEWNYYYKNGQIKSKGSYLDGAKEGKWIYYFSDGKKEQQGSYKANKLKGEWKWYYHNGAIRKKEFYNRKEELEGTVYEYDSLGNEMTKGEYYNGLREGEWFYHVGDFKEVGAYTLGQEDGIWNYYYLNGKLAFTGSFNEGEAKGKHIYYHQNGIPKQYGKYIGGEKHGKWRTFDENGIEIQVIEYKRGEIRRIDGFKIKEIEEEE